MARIRSIKPEFFDHERLCSLSFAHRLCFVGLWTQADKAGRMEDRPLRLKARIFPYDDVDMEAILRDLTEAGFIVRYEVGGQRYLAIPEASWKEHQRPRKDELESVLPPISSGTVTTPLRRSDDIVTPQSVGGMREEVGGMGEEGRASCAEPLRDSAPPTRGPSRARVTRVSPTVLVFPVIGPDGPEWPLMEHQLDAWQEQFPTLDVKAEALQAQAWVLANLNRRKTVSGMPKFLVGWFTRSANRGGGRRFERGGMPPRTAGNLAAAARFAARGQQ